MGFFCIFCNVSAFNIVLKALDIKVFNVVLRVHVSIFTFSLDTFQILDIKKTGLCIGVCVCWLDLSPPDDACVVACRKSGGIKAPAQCTT